MFFWRQDLSQCHQREICCIVPNTAQHSTMHGFDRFSRANNIYCTVPTGRATSSQRQVAVRLLGLVGLRCTFLSQPGILLRIFCTSNRTGMRTPNRSVVRLRVRRPIVTSRAPDGTNPSNLDLNSVRWFGL